MKLLFDPNAKPEDQGANQKPTKGPEENRVRLDQTFRSGNFLHLCADRKNCGRNLGEQHKTGCEYFVAAEE